MFGVALGHWGREGEGAAAEQLLDLLCLQPD